MDCNEILKAIELRKDELWQLLLLIYKLFNNLITTKKSGGIV